MDTLVSFQQIKSCQMFSFCQDFMGLDLTSALPYVEEQLLKDFSKNGDARKCQGEAWQPGEAGWKATKLQVVGPKTSFFNGVMEPL